MNLKSGVNIKEESEESQNDKVIPYLNRAERRKAQRKGKTQQITLATAMQGPISRAEVFELMNAFQTHMSETVSNQLTEFSEAHNSLIHTITSINNLGETLIQALLQKGVITMDDLKSAFEALQAEQARKVAEEHDPNNIILKTEEDVKSDTE